MFGGRIDHPACDLKAKLKDDQFLCGPTLYTIKRVEEGHAGSCVLYENVDGVNGVCGDHEDYPIPDFIKKLLTV